MAIWSYWSLFQGPVKRNPGGDVEDDEEREEDVKAIGQQNYVISGALQGARHFTVVPDRAQ